MNDSDGRTPIDDINQSIRQERASLLTMEERLLRLTERLMQLEEKTGRYS